MAWEKFGARPDRLRGRKAVERRLRWLAQHPLCIDCERAGRVRLAEEVDHVIPLFKGGPDSWSNLASRCRPCHLRKSIAERGHKPRAAFDAQGNPIEG